MKFKRKFYIAIQLKKVDKTLRDIGLSKLADEGLKILNRSAEDAVKEETPIFVNAVKDITFTDAKTILLGNDDAATQYLTGKTQTTLYDKFYPVIKNSFAKVGAEQIWENLIFHLINLFIQLNTLKVLYVLKLTEKNAL